MEYTLALNILGLVLVSLGRQTVSCPNFRRIELSASDGDVIISSSNYPRDYGGDEYCQWKFYTSNDNVLKATLHDFHLQPGDVYSRCLYDSLGFYDGDGSDSLLGKYCGNIHPEVIYSTGKEMQIYFLSDHSSSYKGFNISVSAVKAAESYGMCRVSAEAGKFYWPNATSGMLYTPDYPVPYPGGTNCFWTITVPVGRRVKLTFEDFDLEKRNVYTGYRYCKNDKNIDVQRDYVEIRDGPWSSSREIGIYCGNNLDIEFYSTGHHMWIKFHSTSSVLRQRKGFKAHFEAVEPIISDELCLPGNINNDNLKITGLHGALQSPLLYYPPNLNCDWLITVPGDSMVELSFDRFELDRDGAAGACKGDFVDILDGQDSDSESLGKFCGFTSPGPILSSSRYMRVRFRSDSGGPVYPGFKASFSAVKKSSSTLLVFTILIFVSYVILIALLVGGILYFVKRRKTPVDCEARAAIPVSPITNAAFHDSQAGDPDYPPQVSDQREETPCPMSEVGTVSMSSLLLQTPSDTKESEEPPSYSE